MLRSLPLSLKALVAGLALSASADAWALSCDEILNMVRVNVPSNIVIQTMENSGTKFTSADVSCLSNGGAPEDVVAVARNLSGPSATPDSTVDSAPLPPPEEEEDEADILGGSFDAGAVDPEATEASAERGPAKVEELLERYRAKQYLTASRGLYLLLEDNTYPDQESKLQYYLGRALFDLGMYHSAQHYFLQVVRRGPSNNWFALALPRLVSIARYTGNDYELLRIVHKIPPEAFPRHAKNYLYYLMGRKLYERGELSQAAKHFQQISTKSDMYLRSKYYDGVIHNQRGKLRSAVRSFRDVYQAPSVVLADARQAQEYEDLKDLSLMNIARIYFGLQRFDNADSYYALVDRGSTYWPESLFERGYTNFYRNDLNLTLGLLLTVQSPYFRDHEFVPEAAVLRSLSFFNLCDYDEVERSLTQFEASYKPMREELEAFLQKYSSDDPEVRRQKAALYDEAYAAYFVEEHRKTRLSKAMFSRVLRDRDMAAFVRHLEMMDTESAEIKKQTSKWRDSVGESLLKQIETDRQRYQKRAGAVLLKQLQIQKNNLDDLLGQSQIVLFEVVDAQRADYEYKMSTAAVESEADKTIDFATSKDIIYWPFNGEFWRDELGYYRYTEQDQCR